MTDEKTVATTLSVPPIASPLPGTGGDLIGWLGTKDKAETNLIAVLTAERDRAMNEAREAWARRTQDAEEIAGLKAQNKYLERDVQALREQVAGLQQQLETVTAALHALRPAVPL